MIQLENLSCDMLLHRFGNGVKLSRPNSQVSGCSLRSVLKVPLNIYVYDVNNTFHFSNDHNSQLMGLLSNDDAKGRHLSKIAMPEVCDQLIQNNREVVRANAFKILDEEYVRPDGFHAGVTSLKFPIYNEKQNILGVFGCSVPLDSASKQTFSQSLSLLISLGLLDTSATKSSFYPGVMIENTYFSKRESEVLYHLVRGKTAREISQVLNISFRTVEAHISNAKSKMNVRTKSQLIEKIFHLY